MSERMTEAELVALIRSYPIIDGLWCHGCCERGKRDLGDFRIVIEHKPDCPRMKFEKAYPRKDAT